MRVGLWHVRYFLFDIMSQHDVLQAEIYGGTDWKMTEYHAIRDPPMLMKNNQIRQIFTLAQFHQILHYVRSSIDTFGIGDNNGHLFEELKQTIGGIPRGCHTDLWV